MVNMLSLTTAPLASLVSFPHEPAELLFRLRRALPGFTYSSHPKFSHNNQARLPLTHSRIHLFGLVDARFVRKSQPHIFLTFIICSSQEPPTIAFFLSSSTSKLSRYCMRLRTNSRSAELCIRFKKHCSSRRRLQILQSHCFIVHLSLS